MVKATILGHQCNKSKDLRKLSSQVSNKESLILPLKITEGSGFTGKVIRVLLKKGYYVPTNSLKLKK